MIKTTSNDERLANRRRFIQYDTDDKQLKDKHLKAYLSGAKSFRYHGKEYAVKYELVKIKESDAE